MLIKRRLKDGWSKPVKNKSKKTCDICKANLWVNPGGGIYCNGNWKGCEENGKNKNE